MVSFEDLRGRLVQFDYSWIPALFLTALGFLVLGACNSYLIVLTIKELSFRTMLKVFFISVSWGMYTPAFVGEIGSTAYLLRQEGFSVSQGLSVITIDKLLTIAVNTVLFVLGLWLFFPETKSLVYLFTFVGLSIPMFCVFVRPLRKFLKVAVIDKFMPWSHQYFNTMVNFLLNHPRLVLLNVLFSVLRAFLGATAIWIGLVAIGVESNLWAVAFVNFVARMVSYIPITINGLGLLEGAAMTLFQRISIDPEATLLAYLLSRLIMMVFGVVVLLNVLWRKQKFRSSNVEIADVINREEGNAP